MRGSDGSEGPERASGGASCPAASTGAGAPSTGGRAASATGPPSSPCPEPGPHPARTTEPTTRNQRFLAERGMGRNTLGASRAPHNQLPLSRAGGRDAPSRYDASRMEPPAQATTLHGMSRFPVVRMLGAGGMGVVYEVYDGDREAYVALKTLPTLTPENLRRFKNEFRALQDIKHANLVALDELMEVDGVWFFTMELIDGVDFIS